ncbi:MAG: ACT domain-containing protein [Lachnospiraceae bacterium]|nr:ACT domain-containing protein [Lachnospiraceae bacterium]
MEIKKMIQEFSVCKVQDYSQVSFTDEYVFIGKTQEENSLVCITEHVPENTTDRDDGWKAFRIQGVLDFSLIGILSKISTLLAENKIGIFAVSTYNTDYILTKAENYEKALAVLAGNGYQIV